jgi:hypothetical protein
MNECPLHPKGSFRKDRYLGSAMMWHTFSVFLRGLSERAWGRMLANGYLPVYHEGTNDVCYFKETNAR